MTFRTPSRADFQAFIKDQRTILAFEGLFAAASAFGGAFQLVKAESAVITPVVATSFKTVSSLTLLKASLQPRMWVEAAWSGRYKLGSAETIQISVLDRGGAVIAGNGALASVGPANVVGGFHFGAARFQLIGSVIGAVVPVLPGGLVALQNSDALMRVVGSDAGTGFPSATKNADFNADGAITLSVKFGSTSSLNAIDFANVYWNVFTPEG